MTENAGQRAVDDVPTPLLPSLDNPDGLGRYLHAIFTAWARTQPHPEEVWLADWDDLDPSRREAHILMATTLFRLGAESSSAWAVGWDECAAAIREALDSLSVTRGSDQDTHR